MDYVQIYPSPLGRITLISDGRSLIGLHFEGHPPVYRGEITEASVPALEAAKRWLDTYFSGRDPAEPLPIAMEGTPFQRRVWTLLRGIPYGTTVTYGDLAREWERQTGKRMSAQAIGGALGRNPIPIIVPCHRVIGAVIGAGGRLTGYTGGLPIKVQLLRLEGFEVQGERVLPR